MPKSKNFEIYTYEQYDEDCKRIAQWARGKGFNAVYGIPRGGLTPAVRLSHLLNFPLVLSENEITPRTLIVEDIIDSGKRLRKLLRRSGGSKHAVVSLFVSRHGKVRPSFFARKKKSDKKLVLFHWETLETAGYSKTLR